MMYVDWGKPILQMGFLLPDEKLSYYIKEIDDWGMNRLCLQRYRNFTLGIEMLDPAN
jgi:hypothetical protein